MLNNNCLYIILRMMKKNLLKVAFVVTIAMVSGINVFNAKKSESLSDIALANVEALASNEINPNISYGYALRECKDSEGRVTGEQCKLYYPSAECDNRRAWGECY